MLWECENLSLELLKLKIVSITFCFANGITVALMLSMNPGATELAPDTIMLSYMLGIAFCSFNLRADILNKSLILYSFF